MEAAQNPLGSGYAVHLPIYDGPIALLLHLIERQELDITEVSLVAITDQYLRAIEQLEEIEPEALADFLGVAARLLYIKSRGLLPRASEEEAEEKPSDALIQQLLDYRRFKGAVDELRLRAEIGLRTTARLAPPPAQMERRLDLSSLTIAKLAEAANRALQSLPSSPATPTVRVHPITVAEKIADIRERFNGYNRANGASDSVLPFAAFLSQSRSRLEIVVTFLAVLELIKRREIAAEQQKTFGEIVLRSVA